MNALAMLKGIFSRRRIHRFSQFIDRPITVLVVLLAFIIFCAFAITSGQEKERIALEEIHTSAVNTDRILKALVILTTDIKNDGKERDDKQNRLLTCLLVIHGNQQSISAQAEQECRDEANGVLQTFEDSPSAQNNNSRQKARDADRSAPNRSTGSDPAPAPTEPPEEPDNEGVILDLPLLPKVHIPSPL